MPCPEGSPIAQFGVIWGYGMASDQFCRRREWALWRRQLAA